MPDMCASEPASIREVRLSRSSTDHSARSNECASSVVQDLLFPRFKVPLDVHRRGAVNN